MHPSTAAHVSIHAQAWNKRCRSCIAKSNSQTHTADGPSLVLSECTCERNPELIQLVLARLADMVDTCCASCMEPDRA